MKPDIKSAGTGVNNLEAFWMPFSANRNFKQKPRMFVAAKDMHYTTDDGRQVLDGTSGLWCVNAGHCRPRIVEAVQKQMSELDFAPTFQMGHPKPFELASRVAALAPTGLDHVFFTNSGSESVDTALKIALAYHKVRGEGGRFRLIGRERGYHGVGFGGISVGGITPNRKMFGPMLPGVDHIMHTHNIAVNAFTRGQPTRLGQACANDFERVCTLHDPSTIAALIVEPMAGSTGVLPPPVDYLQTLREMCDKHGILLIFDEVITGFGRLGKPFAADYFGVTPDMITCAKGLTNGTIPMGAVLVKKEIFETFMTGPDHMIEFFHGYTYSGNPVAAAAGLATLDTYKEEGLLTRASELASYWEDAVHDLRGLPHVIDIRNIGLVAAVELDPIPGQPTKRAFDIFVEAFEKNLLVRVTGDIIALAPPLIVQKEQIDQIVTTLRDILKKQ